MIASIEKKTVNRYVPYALDQIQDLITVSRLSSAFTEDKLCNIFKVGVCDVVSVCNQTNDSQDGDVEGDCCDLDFSLSNLSFC